MDPLSNQSDEPLPSAFQTTCWTAVLEAARSGGDGEGAFAQFYSDYWDPLYAYVRRRGHSHSEAEEITQAFFVTLFTHNRLARLTREGGRFRSYLVTAMQNFLANSRDKSNAAKRGNGVCPLSLHDPMVEVRIEHTHADVPAEVIYDREWAHLVLRRATQALGDEYARTGKQHVFETLKAKIQGDGSGPPYSQVGRELGMSEGHVKVAVHRLRARFGELLRAEVGRTVNEPEEIQDELRHLMSVLSS